MNSRIRLKFTKRGRIKFISHLNLMGVMQTAFRRNEMPIAYSKGFNPHPIFSIAAPLPLGMESMGEYLDLELDQALEISQIISRLNEQLPEGVHILEGRVLAESDQKCAALVQAADYEIIFPERFMTQEDAEQMMAAEQLMMRKKTKRGEHETNIRGDILSLEWTKENQRAALTCRLATGSNRNLKPELAAQCCMQWKNVFWKPYQIRYVRKELLMENQGRYAPL